MTLPSARPKSIPLPLSVVISFYFILIHPAKCRWSVAAFPERAVSPLPWHSPVAAPLIAHKFNSQIAQSANNNCSRLHLRTQWDVREQC